MANAHAEAEAVINAPAAAIYAVLADYQSGHPKILPPEYFSGLVIEAGGQGAGTVFRVRTRVMGVEREYRMLVAEPEPDRVLAEADQRSELVTTFTVTPEDERRTRVRIATDWNSAPGLAGMIERWMTPPMMRRIYTAELRRLAEHLRSGDSD